MSALRFIAEMLVGAIAIFGIPLLLALYAIAMGVPA